MSDDFRTMLREDRPPPEGQLDVDALIELGLRRRRRRRASRAAGVVGTVLAALGVAAYIVASSPRVPGVVDRPPAINSGPENRATDDPSGGVVAASPEVAERVRGGLGLTVGFGSVWVIAGGELLRVSGDLESIEASPDIPAVAITADAEGIWAAIRGDGLADRSIGSVVRIDPTSNLVGDPVSLKGFEASWIQAGDDALWFAADTPAGAQLLRLDTQSLALAGPWDLQEVNGLTAFLVAGGRVHVVDEDGTYASFALPSAGDSVESLAPMRVVEAGGISLGIAIDGAGNVWLATHRPGSLRRLAPDDHIDVYPILAGAASVKLAGDRPIVATNDETVMAFDGGGLAVVTAGKRAGGGRHVAAAHGDVWILGGEGLVRLALDLAQTDDIEGEIRSRPASGTREPGTTQGAIECQDEAERYIYTVTFNPGEVSPKCLVVGQHTRLRFLNNTDFLGELPSGAVALTLDFAGWVVVLEPGEEVTLDVPAGDYLAPGSHRIRVNGEPAAEVVLVP